MKSTYFVYLNIFFIIFLLKSIQCIFLFPKMKNIRLNIKAAVHLADTIMLCLVYPCSDFLNGNSNP